MPLRQTSGTFTPYGLLALDQDTLEPIIEELRRSAITDIFVIQTSNIAQIESQIDAAPGPEGAFWLAVQLPEVNGAGLEAYAEALRLTGSLRGRQLLGQIFREHRSSAFIDLATLLECDPASTLDGLVASDRRSRVLTLVADLQAALPAIHVELIETAMPVELVPKPAVDDTMPIPFGIQAETGAPLPGLRSADLDHIGSDPTMVRVRALNAGASHLGITVEANADDLGSAGWAIVFASDMDPAGRDAIKDALKPLLSKRKAEAGGLFRVFEGPDGYDRNLDNSAEAWLNRHGAGNAVAVDPSQGVPYYVLLVGTPDQIPFSFQYELDVLYAVGRLCFENPEEYARYARNIVEFETGTAAQAKNLAIYCTKNDGDPATRILHDEIAVPIALGSGMQQPVGSALGYGVQPLLGENATKSNLIALLKDGIDGAAPAVIFSGSHGVAFKPDDPLQSEKQGAILTQDWGGGAPGADEYFTGDDVPPDARLAGTIHFLFACYGAGCPVLDTFTYGPDKQPRRIAAKSLVARLPQKLLLAGAQAVIGHIDRAWAFSFRNSTGAAMTQNFRDPLVRILQTRRVGDALDVFDQRWTSLGNDLSQLMLKRMALPGDTFDKELANRWVARDDARNYVVLGDPAVRLRPAPAGAAPRPAIVRAVDSVETLQNFTGVLKLKIAVSPDCGYHLVGPALTQCSHIDACIGGVAAPHLMALLQQARDRGATVRLGNPQEPRVVVLDRRTVLLGSANWTTTGIPMRDAAGPRAKGSREWLVRIDDEAVASWFVDHFAASGAATPATATVPTDATFRLPAAAAPRDFAVAEFAEAQITATPLLAVNYLERVLPLIRSAQRRIWIEQQYIHSGGGTAVPRLLEALAQKAEKVDVRIIASSKFRESWNQTKRTLDDAHLLERLRAINLDHFTHCHNKGLIVDDAVVISSIAWSEESIGSGSGAGLLIQAAPVAGFLAQVFADDWRTGWSVATADTNAVLVDATGEGEEGYVDPADRV